MKNTKKLLILVLSLMLLVAACVTVAFAESPATNDVLTVQYPDGTVETYALGDVLVPKAVPTEFVAIVDGKGYQYTVTGNAWEGLPTIVTEDLLGTTVNATIAGTMGTEQIYFAVYVTDGETIYYTNADTAAKDFKTYMTTMNAAGSTTVLYSDITCEGIAIHGKKESVYRLDVNGYKLTLTSNAGGGAFDVRANNFYLYSSRPGGVVDSSKVSHLFRDNDSKYDGIRIDGGFHIGEYDDSRTDYGKNLTVYCQAINSDMYGGNAYLNGGTYIQSNNSTSAYLLLIGRLASNESHVQRIRNCNFVVTKAGTGFVWHFTNAARTYQNCNFINLAGGSAPLFANTTMNVANTMDNCTFYNVNATVSHGGQAINYKSNCYYSFAGALPERAANEFYAHGAPKTVSVNGETYTFDGTFIKDTSTVAAINWAGAYTDYWAEGVTPYCNLEALNVIEENADGTAGYKGNATVDPSVLTPITADQLGKEIYAAATYNTVSSVAFAWKVGNATYQVLLADGMTKTDVGQAFHDTFDTLDFAAEIKLYTDLILPEAMGWGPMGVVNTNVPEYHSLEKGNVTLDLNGHTFEVAITDGINVSNSDAAGSYPLSSEAVFGFENNAGNTFTLKSSRPGAMILNDTTFSFFAVGEGDSAKIVIDGANITYIGQGAVSHSFEANSSIKPSLTVNGGTYVITSNRPAFSFLFDVSIKDAKIALLGDAPQAVFAMTNWKRAASFTVENTVIYSKNTVPLHAFIGSGFGAATPADNSVNYSLTFNNCAFSGVTLVSSIANIDSLKYEGVTKADTEANLLAVYGAVPAGTTVAQFKDVLVYGDEKLELNLLSYGKSSEIVTVIYGGLAPKEYYVIGSLFTPVDPMTLKDTYYKLNSGYFVDIEGYKGDMANAYVTADMVGKTLDAVANINYVEKAMSFVVLDGETPVAHGLAASDTIGADLVAAIAAANNGAVIRLYVDVNAGAIANANAVTLDLAEKTLTVNAAFANAALLTVKNGTLVLTADVDALFAGAVAIENVALYNVAAEAALTSATATVKDAKVYNLLLSDKATLLGTVFYTDEAASLFGENVTGNVIYNNNLETITVNGASFAITYTRAATDDATLVAVATFAYRDAVKGTTAYVVGSIPAFYLEALEGYYFSYATEAPILESTTFVCSFKADESKLKAQIVVTDALNFTFFFEKQDGVQKIVFMGKEVDLAALPVEAIDGAEYYVLTVEFETFADSLKAVTLAADILLGDTVETVSAEISLLDYAVQIFDNAAATAEDKALVYALVAYVDAIVDYFAYDIETNVSEIVATYAEYATEYVAPDAEKISSDYVKGILYIVDERVSLALRVDHAFAGEITVGDKVFTAEDITVLDGKSYFILKDLAFSEITSDFAVEVRIAGELVENFTYSFATYTDAMTVQNMGFVPMYVKTLYTFATLAAAYVA